MQCDINVYKEVRVTDVKVNEEKSYEIIQFKELEPNIQAFRDVMIDDL